MLQRKRAPLAGARGGAGWIAGLASKWAMAVLMSVTLLTLSGCGTALPDTTGMSVLKASAAIKAAGFAVGKVIYDEKASTSPGLVTSQEPAGGQRLKPGSRVILTIAGPAPVSTPDLGGMDKPRAEAALAAGGLKLGDVTESYDSSVSVGAVISQTPMMGVEAPKGSAVVLVLSKGPKPIAILKVGGKTQADAVKLLKAAGFKVTVKQKSDKAKKGTIIAQQPASGDALPGTTIVISVSTGVVASASNNNPGGTGGDYTPPNFVVITNNGVLYDLMPEAARTEVESILAKALRYDVSLSNDPGASSAYRQVSKFNVNTAKMLHPGKAYAVTIDNGKINSVNHTPWDYSFSLTVDDGRRFAAHTNINPDNEANLISIKKAN